jgi:hypothetical protein
MFEGGVTYAELRDMPIPELMGLHAEAVRINRARRKA